MGTTELRLVMSDIQFKSDCFKFFKKVILSCDESDYRWILD